VKQNAETSRKYAVLSAELTYQSKPEVNKQGEVKDRRRTIV